MATYTLDPKHFSPDVLALNPWLQDEGKPAQYSADVKALNPELKNIKPLSHLEADFYHQWILLNGPLLATEYRFHQERKWRLDFYHADSMTAIEIEGGTRSGGRHTRHEGFRGDAEKYNAAERQGIKVFRLTSDMINPAHIEPIIEYVRECDNQ